MGYYEQYIEKTPKSAQAAKRASAIIPGGVGSAIQYWAPYPIYIKDSKGSRVWDMDDNEYIESAWQILGYAQNAKQEG